MLVEVKWRFIGPRSECWGWSRSLYAYVHPTTDKILYLGKADGTTVRGRFHAPDKQALFEFFAQEQGINRVRVSVGTIFVDQDRRLSRELLADVESLLLSASDPLETLAGRGHASADQA